MEDAYLYGQRELRLINRKVLRGSWIWKVICPKRSFEETTNFVKNDILDKELLIMKAIYGSFHTS